MGKQREEDQGLADSVYRTLVDLLISKEIQPGQRMSIDAISRRLDVSQTPVRQVLMQLEKEGLLTRVHLSGYRAAPLLTWEQFDQLFQMRILLEPFAAGRAAVHHTPEQLGRMLEAEQQMSAMAIAPDRLSYADFARADARLHDLIAVASGNAFLAQAQIRLHAHVHLFRLYYDARVPQDAIGEHEQLIEAIVERDEPAAEQVMRRHLRASRARLYGAFADQAELHELDTQESGVHDDFD
jgi:DNA-binding GntR family transcriptional regulator